MREKIGTMLGDVAQGFIHKPATRQFPAERHAAPERFRGMLQWDAEKCNGCGLCVKDCPANALEVITIDKATKRIVVRYHLDHCTFCGQCVESCNHDALALSPELWELASDNKESMVVLYGSDADIEVVLGGFPPAGTEPPAKE